MTLSANLRRFSYGGSPSGLLNVAVWKFDVQIGIGPLQENQLTAYVKCAMRADAFRTFFARHPGAKIFGTGLPLSNQDAEAEVGRLMRLHEVVVVADCAADLGRLGAPGELDDGLLANGVAVEAPKSIGASLSRPSRFGFGDTRLQTVVPRSRNRIPSREFESMSGTAGLFETGLGVLLLALPLGVVAGIAGARSWIAFWIVSLILIAIATLLFVSPAHRILGAFASTAAMATWGVLFDGLLFRAGLRAILLKWDRRTRRPTTQTLAMHQLYAWINTPAKCLQPDR